MKSAQKYDFSGYVTRANIRCTDGRVIKPDAFKDNDNRSVPMVYHHNHSDMSAIIGNVLLENRNDGVYGYGSFNDTEKGQLAKKLVQHGDVTSMSIYANKLVQKGSDVIHGIIREVSLVLAGANDGAFIDNVVIQHGSIVDGTDDILDPEEAVIVCGSDLKHSDSETEVSSEETTVEHSVDNQTETPSTKLDIKSLSHEVKNLLSEELSKKDKELEHAAVPMLQDVLATMNEEQLSVIEMYLLNRVYGDEVTKQIVDEMSISTSTEEAPSKTVQEIIDTMSDEQKNAFYTLIESIEEEFGEEINALDEAEAQATTTNTAAMQQNDGGSDIMKQNPFEQNGVGSQTVTLEHNYDNVLAAMADTKKWGSMKESFLQHGITDQELGQILKAEGKHNFLSHGIQDVDLLFPDARAVNSIPDLIKTTPDSWIEYVMSNTKHLPFSRVKSWALDITEEEARAKGYVKGSQKVEEVIKAMRRITTPTTVYKLQKMDRDDIVDITDFDVVMFLKQEMRYKLREEIARAILVGDGRTAGSPDKINEDNIRPIWTDVAPYVVRVTLAANLPIMELVNEVIKSRKDFAGTGTPAFFGSPDTISDMLIMRAELDQRRIYSSEAELASEMRVSSIHDVPVMDELTRVNSQGDTVKLLGIVVNLRDYSVGTNAGGQVTMFDDFDIDFNKYTYLIETRMSGALTIPRSAIVIEQVVTPAP